MPIRLTKNRTHILETLKAHHGTFTATELHARLPEMDLATIYRNLDLFVQEKLIKKVHLDSSEAHYEFQHEPHQHAICTNCDRVMHFTVSETALAKVLPLGSFVAEEFDVTIRGRCKACC